MKQDKATFTHRSTVNLFIDYELDTWLKDLYTDFKLSDCLFGAMKLIKNAVPDKYAYGGYGIGFVRSSQFLLPNSEWGKKKFFFGVVYFHYNKNRG